VSVGKCPVPEEVDLMTNIRELEAKAQKLYLQMQYGNATAAKKVKMLDEWTKLENEIDAYYETAKVN